MENKQSGVCAAKGFMASGIHCGIRKNKLKKDLALIVSDRRASAAAVYTTNLVKGAPIAVTKENISDGYAQAMICNSGNANTCNANGEEIARGMCDIVEKHTGIPACDVIVASTGVIGQKLDLTPILNGAEELCSGLGYDSSCAAQAIMTTDTKEKMLDCSFVCSGVECRMGGIAKGSGMIHPNMATLLVFITTDCAITPEMLSLALGEVTQDTFNMISVDGDTSTNDMVSVLANGAAGNACITGEGADFDAFKSALFLIMNGLSKMIAGDGEGATKLLICEVSGAKDIANAKIAAKSVICSSLFKAAMFGADANWGRVLCALGYSGAEIDITKVAVSFSSCAGEIAVCENGAGVDFDEAKAKEILTQKEITVSVALGDGVAQACAYGCDLTYDYVKINGDYRT